MGNKGNRTKELICAEAYKLFAEKGFKDVTMKDICERTGLSRGGLYRHYDSTEQIFLEIIHALMQNQQNEFAGKISHQIPAVQILNEVFQRYEAEMTDSDRTLSIAIYEFFSRPGMSQGENSVLRQYLLSKSMWTELIEYGIRTGEFKRVDPEAVYDLIVFSYQGVRMYSRLMKIDPEVPRRILEQIRGMLCVPSALLP